MNESAAERLIVALDFDTADQAHALIDKLGDTVGFYKVGWQLFLGEHWSFVTALLKRGKRVFLDLKISDIEETVRAALANMPHELRDSLELVTIHGNGATVKAARAGRNGNRKPLILMLTALSSWNELDIRDFLSNDHVTLDDYVMFKATRALEAGCDGLIASGESVKMIRERLGNAFLLVVPGVRPAGAAKDDHKRTLTPQRAIEYGADYLVVGRPITRADDPAKAALNIIAEMSEAMQRMKR